MIQLNLIPDNPSEQKIKNYLEENVSEILAEKINNGVKITKDNKTLINKKSLKDFMKYASQEARKTVKNSDYACIEDNVVYGWAIHYFEEDSIEGKLYNEDGTKYNIKNKVKTKPVVKDNSTTTINVVKPEPKKENTQFSIFDMMSQQEETVKETKNETLKEVNEHEETEEINKTVEEITEEPKKNKISDTYINYMNIQNQYMDCIVIYRIGDFYEIMGKNAELVGNELELTITGRDFGLDKRIPIVGMPYHTIDNYISKLISNGHKVAIVEENALTRLIETEKHKDKNIDNETGEIIKTEESEDDFDPTAFDPEALTILLEKFDNKIIVE